jgi:hypothetical protein
MEETLEFKAKMEDGQLVIQPIIVKDEKGNVTVKLPSLELINNFKQQLNNQGEK